ncbi:natriuretic peptides A-like [Rana temporaria]|uniref:natriuretic peptides A-like n=1 Tax=Rana temporaria TaxID=8407 RepID=UPI001AAE0CB7|nr:natriuretic peptides A-like [Rana temporaria]
MEWKAYLLCSSLLLVSLQLQSSTAHPITQQDTDSDLDSFKIILGRLEEKLEELEGNPETMEDRAQRPNDGEAPLQEAEVTDSNPFPLSNLLKGLRLVRNKKMTKSSNCFGRRIDRIDSVSGMGCNGSRNRYQ